MDIIYKLKESLTKATDKVQVNFTYRFQNIPCKANMLKKEEGYAITSQMAQELPDQMRSRIHQQ